jgi:hypothetical protein
MGIPNQETISGHKQAFLVHVGKSSTHSEKVQANTNRYLHPRAHGILVKSMIKFSRGVPSTLCT